MIELLQFHWVAYSIYAAIILSVVAWFGYNLTREEIIKIVDIQIRYLNERFAEKGMILKLTEKAKETLATYGYDPVFGARPLKRAIQRYIENPLALKILEGAFNEGDKIITDVNERGEFEFRKE